MLNREESYGEMIKEMKLAYAPINKIFEELLTEVVKSLKLSGLIGVNNSAELEFIVSDRKNQQVILLVYIYSLFSFLFSLFFGK